MSVFLDAWRDGQAVGESEHSFIIEDLHPLSKGHVLACPRREVVSLFDLTTSEEMDLWRLIREYRPWLLAQPGVSGLRVMVNEGPTANGGPQHIAHLHVHIIPWYPGMQP